ncbi:hypothetical protein VAE122_1560004 [Vibrio aestuarianus]|nr:hypothetical protein VAE122_1560004 [Vibrio aestuarianus]
MRLTGYRVFDIFTALGRLGLGRLSKRGWINLPEDSLDALLYCLTTPLYSLLLIGLL